MAVGRDTVVGDWRSVVSCWLCGHTREGLDWLGCSEEAIAYGLWDARRVVVGSCHCGSSTGLDAMFVAHRGAGAMTVCLLRVSVNVCVLRV